MCTGERHRKRRGISYPAPLLFYLNIYTTEIGLLLSRYTHKRKPAGKEPAGSFVGIGMRQRMEEISRSVIILWVSTKKW